jgi:hypothetical protein
LANQLPVEKLRNVCDVNFLHCESTKDLVPLNEIIGQERAVRALKFGLGIKPRLKTSLKLKLKPSRFRLIGATLTISVTSMSRKR